MKETARRARELVAAERPDEALALTAPLVAGGEPSLGVLTAHAAALKAVERTFEALEANRRAVELHPANPVAWHNYASTLGDLGRSAEALEAADKALSLGGDAPETWLVRARALLALRQPEAAEAAFRETLKRRPGYFEAHRDLAQLIWMRTEDPKAALGPAEEALQRNPDDVGVLLAKAKALGFAGLHADAWAAAFRAFQLNPADVSVGLAAAHHAGKAGDATSARVLAETAYRRAPGSRAAVEAWCTVCLSEGRADLAFEASGKALLDRPLDQLLLAFHAIAARVLGRPEYQALYDYAAFVRPYDVQPPAGWPSQAAYLADLKAALERLHGFRGHPFDQSLRHGSQTMQNLLLSEEPAVRAFFTAIDAPIRAYMAAVGSGPDPLRARNTGDYAIRGAWSVRLRPGGYHVDHVHPQGWLSSAFYVETPDAALGGEDRGGWIKFGQPQIPVEPPLQPAHYVRPAPGRLVLFPSYMFHGTVPFTSEEGRLTIAFDVVPAQRPA